MSTGAKDGGSKSGGGGSKGQGAGRPARQDRQFIGRRPGQRANEEVAGNRCGRVSVHADGERLETLALQPPDAASIDGTHVVEWRSGVMFGLPERVNAFKCAVVRRR